MSIIAITHIPKLYLSDMIIEPLEKKELKKEYHQEEEEMKTLDKIAEELWGDYKHTKMFGTKR